MTRALAFALLALGLGPSGLGCGSREPLRTVPHVELARFMGDWYVIAHLPLHQERNAYDAIEHYDLERDGTIRVTFTYREGSHDGEAHALHLRAWVHDDRTNAEWRVRPFWPIAMNYLVIHLDADYQVTVIGHPSRDYVWVMSRTPTLSADRVDALCSELEGQGYDLTRLRLVPQRAR